MLRGEHHRGIAGVNTGILDMLTDGILHDIALVGHSVELYLFRVLHELRHHNRIFLAHLRGHAQETLQLLVAVAHVHRGTRQHIRGTDQHGIAYLAHKLLDVVERGQGTPRGLVDAQLVEHGGELVAVLGTVDVDGRGAQHGHTLAVQLHGQVVGYLAAHTHDGAARLLKVYHVEHTLQRQLVEVEAVAHVVVGRHRLGVVVDHDRLGAELTGGLNGIHRAPVELHRRTDAVGTGTQHHHRLLVLVEVDVVALHAVGHIQIVGQLGMLAGHRVDALHGGLYAVLLAVAAHLKVLLHHVALAGFQHETSYLEIGETGGFHLAEEFVTHVLQMVVFHQFGLQVDNVLQALQEPYVYLRELLDALHSVAFFQSLGNGEDAQVGGVGKLLLEIVKTGVVVAHKTVHALAYHAKTLLNHLLAGAADGHNLTHRLHR